MRVAPPLVLDDAGLRFIDPERRLFSEIATLFFPALVALEPLVSLMSWLGAFSARISGDRQTHRPSSYPNPRCTCAPRVNYEPFSVCKSN